MPVLLLSWCKLLISATASKQPATSHHCPAQLATLLLILVTNHRGTWVFSWVEKQLNSYSCPEVTIRSELGFRILESC